MALTWAWMWDGWRLSTLEVLTGGSCDQRDCYAVPRDVRRLVDLHAWPALDAYLTGKAPEGHHTTCRCKVRAPCCVLHAQRSPQGDSHRR